MLNSLSFWVPQKRSFLPFSVAVPYLELSLLQNIVSYFVSPILLHRCHTKYISFNKSLSCGNVLISMHAFMPAQLLPLCLTLCDAMDSSQPGSFVLEFLQARILEWVAKPFSRGSSRPRVQTHIPCDSCIAGGVFTHWANRKAPYIYTRL